MRHVRQDRRTVACSGFVVSDSTHAPGVRLAPHRHAFACVHLVLEGWYEEEAEGASLKVPAGAALVKRAGVEHSNRFAASGARTVRIEIHRALPELENALRGTGRGAERAARMLDSPVIRGGGERLLRRLRQDGPTQRIATEALCLEMLAAVIDDAAAEEPAGPEVVRWALERVRDAFRAPRPLRAIAAELHMDPARLSRAVRKATGRSLGEHVREARVRWVAERLCDSDETVGALSLAAGFSDQSHCVRVFRQRIGQSPSAYRASVRGG